MQVEGNVLNENIPVEPDKNEKLEYIDFKMVTFSLGGKDYGIDIMHVKEISRVNDFTYVPNTAHYVRGVYNLRGEIISVMDLRKLFNLDAVTAKDGLDDLIVLKSEEHMTGAVVDSIDRVVGVNSSRIQPPHPLFAEINIYFIKGVVEFEGRLYIILDVERILSTGKTVTDEFHDEEGDVAVSAKALPAGGWNQPAPAGFNSPAAQIAPPSRPAVPAQSAPQPQAVPAARAPQQPARAAQPQRPAAAPVQAATPPSGRPAASRPARAPVRPAAAPAAASVKAAVPAPAAVKAKSPEAETSGNVLGDILERQQDLTDNLVEEMKQKRADAKSAAQGSPASAEALNPAAQMAAADTGGETGSAEAGALDGVVSGLEHNLEFFVSDVNREWIEKRFTEVSKVPASYGECEEFLAPFFSRSTGDLWSEVMLDELIDLLPGDRQSTVYGWNAGCGAGHESYSMAVALNEKYSNLLTRIWANDTDLVNVSMAPSLSLDESEVPVRLESYLEDGRNGKKFTKQIMDSILFEYHDLTNDNPYPDMDLIVARDFISYVEEDKISFVINDFVAKLNPGGLLIIGENETLSHPDLVRKESRLFNVFVKKSE